LPLRPPWTDSVDFYAGIVSSSVPALGPRLDALVRTIREGLTALEQRMDMRPHDVVHGDFYEAQVFVDDGKVVGLLDIDTVGPGRPDGPTLSLACWPPPASWPTTARPGASTARPRSGWRRRAAPGTRSSPSVWMPPSWRCARPGWCCPWPPGRIVSRRRPGRP